MREPKAKPSTSSSEQLAASSRRASAGEVGAAFFKLGVSSFGGPIAHVGYFRREFVERRRWLEEKTFAQLLALCQFLPGPTSSQLGFSLGLLRAGWPGALAAFIGFTLPSALVMFALAEGSDYILAPWGGVLVHALKLVAVAVVAHGVLGMARSLTPDPPRALLAASAASLVIISGNAWMQLVVIAAGAALGGWLCRTAMAVPGERFVLRFGWRTGGALLAAFGGFLVLALFAAPWGRPLGQVAGAFYRAGALVFGGGHVVLPLLKKAVVDPGWIDNGTFLAAYGAAQAVPGPMFTVSVFLGDRLHGVYGGVAGAAVGMAAIFLPGLLVMAGVLPFWQSLSARDGSARVLAGVNAAVVGLLAAALYDPVWISAVHDGWDFAFALVGFALLAGARWPAWTVVAWCVCACLLRSQLSSSWS